MQPAVELICSFTVHRIPVHESCIDKQLLAFSRDIAQDAAAIFILACLSATRPFSGRSFKVIHNTQIVRFHARSVRGIYVMEAKQWLLEL